jgi:DNA repair ATPase RecN
LFLASEGYALKDLIDYDDGATVEQIWDMVENQTRTVVMRQKAHALGTFLAVASLFDKGKPLQKFFKALDDDVEKIFGNGEEALEPKEMEKISERALDTVDPDRKERERLKKVQHTVKELNKLRYMFRYGQA